MGDLASRVITFDASARTYDADGRLHVAKSHISKATVNPYYGSEIPGYDSLGIDPQRVYYLLRDPEELTKAAPTFARLPILKKHVPISADDLPKDLIIGSIGSDVVYNDPYLDADLSFWDAEAISLIESGKVKELSCAYRYRADMTPGTFQGVAYDGIMRDIVGNHLALVETGRAGHDVVVADRNPFGVKTMRMTKKGKAIAAALSAASPRFALDAVAPIVAKAGQKAFDLAAAKKALLALDEEFDPQQVDNIIDAILDVEQDPEPQQPKPPVEMGEGDASPREKVRSLLDGKVGEEVIAEILELIPEGDEEAKDEKHEAVKPEAVKPEDVQKAMDALRAEMRAAMEAARDVRPVVGDVAMDSARDIYAFALDQLKVEHEGITDVAALRALFRVAAKAQASSPAPAVAQDSAGLASKFPSAKRFRVI